MSTLAFAPDDADAIPLLPVTPESLDAALATLPPDQAAWARRLGFRAGAGEVAVLPGPDGIARALIGRGKPEARARGRFALAQGASRLPEGIYRLDGSLDEHDAREAALGWLLEGYRFARYREQAAPKARLVAPEGVDAQRIEALARAEALTRDLINTPASDMGPAELEAAAREVAERFGASIAVTTGDELLAANFPMIHAVGRAAAPHRAPRLIDIGWGSEGPKLTLVGKGVCFDTGGLDIKPAASMLTMKKDMGGAANVLGLAQAIMGLGLPLRLRVLIPAVENAIGSDAFRPGDILRSRKGLTVEINNTDAEGRLVLADALALAAEDEPDLTVSFATLTGAARVAVGPDLAPFFTDDEDLASALTRGGRDWADPVWRLPFHEPYETMIEPGIADLDNAPSGGMAGAITAALFLRRFAPARYCHFDIFAWSQANAPGRTKGGLMQGPRALLAALPEALGL
ncbi:leucyl aminopeptidase family protein [Rubellimicrobium rubrum]|uniref:Leucyl aminopeptidase family protein n=1 Tax=Rubellimicrobium rubrum TaxID=2585369 RepID=A0A5C4N3L3_9RHOB|nr:leucyl aminopeptidase family protein [Rubellimicrobium rubrum]TNC51467.1 leucyl aminopeptidase family protein [Rubellimicrobium rubrum]